MIEASLSAPTIGIVIDITFILLSITMLSYIIAGIVFSLRWMSDFRRSERYYHFTIYRSSQSKIVVILLDISNVVISILIHIIHIATWAILLAIERLFGLKY